MNNFISKFYLLFAILLFVHPSLQAQRTIDSEKVYLHTDKHIYKPSSILAYTLFLLHEDNTFNSTSNIAIMELIDGKGNILSTYKFRMEEGLGNGSLWTPNTGGQYTLRAYTSYQQNQKKKHFMERTFFVQKSVQQKLLITIDTDKNNYIPGDSIHAKIRITEPGAGNLTDLLCTASLVFDGKILHATSGSTDSEGVANLAFRVPYSFAESVIYLKAESSLPWDSGIENEKNSAGKTWHPAALAYS
jgi:hypothetical protein